MTATLETPAPERLGWDEVLFWTGMGAHALLPGRAQVPLLILGCPVMPYDAALIGVAGLLLLTRWQAIRMYGRPLLLASLAFLGALVWGLLSLPLWAGSRDLVDSVGRTVPLLAAGSAWMAAYILVAGRPAAAIAGVIDRATLFLAAIGFAYASKSLLAPGLEISLIRDAEQRARGPLFGPAVGHFALLPALGHALGRTLGAIGRTRLLWAGAAVALLFTVIALGSRGGLLGLGILALLASVRVGGAGRRLAIAAGIALAVGLGALVWMLAPQERLTSSEDPFRERIYASAAGAFGESPAEVLRGQGAGAVWPWYADDAARSVWEGAENNNAVWRGSRWGDTLMHPHSLPLYMSIELGLPGMLALIALVASLALAYRDAARDEPWQAGLAAGLAASLVALAFDLPLMKSFTLSTLWWIMLLGLLALQGRRATGIAATAYRDGHGQ